MTMKLYKFVKEMDKVLLRIRNNELEDEYRSRHIKVELSSHLMSLERHAVAIYTRPIFFMVRDEIIKEQHLVVKKTGLTGMSVEFSV